MKNRTYLNVVLALALTLGCTVLHAEEWIDVTDTYVINPSFTNNTNEGWEGTTIGHAMNVGAGEHWNMTFDSYQNITGLTPGHYRVSVQSFCRKGGIDYDDMDDYLNGTEVINAYLYANDVTTPLVSFYSQYSDTYVSGCSHVYYSGVGYVYMPNNMEGAVNFFSKDLFWNSVEVDVTDGNLRIGQRRDIYEESNWTCFDNWKLEYYGTVVNVTKINLSAKSLALSKADTHQLTYTLTPSNATYQKLTWQSSNSAVATVDQDGLVTAVGNGNATITATSKDSKGASASCAVTVTTEYATAASCVVNEIMPANIDVVWDPSQNYGGFVEFYNPTSKSVYMGEYYLSESRDNLKQWRIPAKDGSLPAKGFCTIWFDHWDYKYAPQQCNFSLDIDGDTLFLSNQDGELIVSFPYPAAFRRASYARTTENGNIWHWTAEPTPNATNTTSTFTDTQLAAPVVDKPGQVFDGWLNVIVTIPAGATLRYTTDGSTPTLTNGETSADGSFRINATTAYRFRLFQDGYLPSDVVTRTYINKEYDYNVPIISVVTDDDHINSSDYGLFKQGQYGRPGNGQSAKCNWNREWDRPVSLEFMEEGEEYSFAQDVDMAMCGGWSRAFTPHSFKLKANKLYSLNYLPHTFFENKPFNRNKTLQIRNGGNDTSCRFTDPSIQTVVARSGLNIDCQSYKPVFVYLNGKFYSVLNMREPNNKHFAAANWGLDADDIDQFELSPDSGYVQKAGDREVFDLWYELSKNAADADVYEQIKQIVDIDEYINYMATEMYLGCQDWINNSNNMKGYRPRREGGKFRFVLFDLDSSFGSTNYYSSIESARIQTLDPLYDCEESALTKEIEPITIWLNMMQNKDFCKQYADALCIITGSVFEPTRCQEILDELYERANTAMSQTGGSPYSSYNSVRNALSASRQPKVISAAKGYSRLGLSSTNTISGSLSSNITEATILVNGLPVPTNKFSGQLFTPITVKASSQRGYRFLGWKDEGGGGGTTSTTLIAKGATWKYYDQGSLDNAGWKTSTFDATTWQQGAAPLGYYTSDPWNQRGYQTFLDYGEDASNKRPTYYFRTSVTLDNAPSSDDTFTLNYVSDDGFVIYVNGVYAGLYLMRSEDPVYSDYASSYAPGNPQEGTLKISADLFKKGVNTIAVEVHNNNATSTDIYWDCALTYSHTEESGEGGSFVSKNPEYTLPTSGTFNLVATYEAIPEEELYENLATPVKVNEVSADNSIFVNDYWKRADWIELYNTTSNEIDVAGMYLSDNVSNPLKFQIPVATTASTLIPAHGHIVIWCDKMTDVSQLHASFKLAKEGGYIILTAADQSWADTLQYAAHTDLQTVGRYPDGGADAYVMNIPTIGATNVLEKSYDTFYKEQRPEPTIVLDESQGSTPKSLVLYDLSGRMIPNGATRYAEGTLPSGIYIFNGRKVTVK